jgi:hypothetical protein
MTEQAVTPKPAPRTSRRSGSRRAGGRQQQRVSITLTNEALNAAQELAEYHKITPGEVVRRAIALMKFLDGAQESGSVLRIETPDGKSERLHVIYV